MESEIVFLGTGSTTPTVKRNHTSIFFRFKSDRFLFDCGEGTQRQLMTSKTSATKLQTIFVTHLHGDHILGLPGLIQTLNLRGREKDLEIIGPKGTEEIVRMMEKLGPYEKTFDVKIKEVDEGKVLETDEYFFKMFPVEHRKNSLGLVFQQKPVKHIDEDKLVEDHGLKPGPLYKKIKQGEKVVHDGEEIDPSDYVFERKGLKICYSGDTRPCVRVVNEAKEADLLIHDSTFSQDALDRAKETNHSTAKEAAEVAREAQVNKLILTHFSPRYKKVHKLRDEARKVFHNTETAEDLKSISF